MEVITCPTELEDASFTRRADHRTESVFLGGGISNCPDWQQDFIANLDDVKEGVLVNPRRHDFDITDPNLSADQIEWEHKHLGAVDAIVFWFPKETLCPITLFKLGKYCTSYFTQLFVGCHPEYARRFDVIKQLSLVNEHIRVVDNLDDLAKQVRGWATR